MALAVNNTGMVKENMYSTLNGISQTQHFKNTTHDNVVNVNNHNILDIEHTVCKHK